MDEYPVKDLNEMEASKPSNKEFKRIVIRMLKELSDNYNELSGNHNSMKEEIKTININKEVMKSKISEKKIHQKELQAGWIKQKTKLVSWKTR